MGDHDSTASALARALADIRSELGHQAPTVVSVLGRVATLSTAFPDTPEWAVNERTDDIVRTLRAYGVKVGGVHLAPSELCSDVHKLSVRVAVEGFDPPGVEVVYDPASGYGHTHRGHAINTAWRAAEGYILLEVEGGYVYTLPVKDGDALDDIANAVQRRMALHYRTADLRDATSRVPGDEPEDFCETQQDAPGLGADHDAPAPEPARTPVYSAHMAQPDGRILGPSLFCAPPACDGYEDAHDEYDYV